MDEKKWIICFKKTLSIFSSLLMLLLLFSLRPESKSFLAFFSRGIHFSGLGFFSSFCFVLLCFGLEENNLVAQMTQAFESVGWEKNLIFLCVEDMLTSAETQWISVSLHALFFKM